MALALFVANVAANLAVGSPLTVAVGVTVADAVEVVAGAWLLRRVCRGNVDMCEVRHVFGLFAVVLLLSPVTALLGAAFSLSEDSSFFDNWLQWWIVDGVGILTVTPFVVSAAALPRQWHKEGVLDVRRLGEFVLLLAAMVFMAYQAIGGEVRSPGSPWVGKFWVLPLLVWAAMRFGPGGAAATSLVMSAVAIATAIESTDVLRATDTRDLVLALQVFLCFANASGAVLAAVETRRRVAQAELTAALELLGRVVEGSPAGIMALDERGAVTIWNPAAERLFGWRRSEVLDRPPPMLGPPDSVFASRVAAALRGAQLESDDVALQRRDERVITCRHALAPLRAANGGMAGAICLMVDVTARLELEAQLRQAQKMEAIGLMASGVAHDFNNILTVILSQASLIARGLPTGDPRHVRLDAIEQASKKAAALTRQLLAFSRPQVFQPRVVRPDALVEAARNLLIRFVREDIQLELALDAGVGAVRIDPSQLDQILINLVVNARDAMPLGGVIRIRTEEVLLEPGAASLADGAAPGSYAVIRVKDTGSGMSPETIRRIFEPFFTTKEPGKGTGLGLAIVANAIQQTGGFVAVDSTPGVGSEFSVYLPLTEETGAEELPAAPVAAPRRAPATILVVEDESEVRSVIRDALAQAGYRTLTASRPSEALAIGDSVLAQVDLLLSDAVMPEMSGPDLAARLTQRRPGLRVMLVSGYADDRVARAVAPPSSIAFLQKPFDNEVLVAKVEEALRPGG